MTGLPAALCTVLARVADGAMTQQAFIQQQSQQEHAPHPSDAAVLVLFDLWASNSKSNSTTTRLVRQKTDLV